MTKIEWTDATWNPVVGCSIISRGCKNCYAMHLAHRHASNPSMPHYKGTTYRVNGKTVWTGKRGTAPDHIMLAPLRWRKPRMVFVNSMSDLFHESVPDQIIDRVFAVMALAAGHTFQVLTKRAGRMERYLNTEGRDEKIGWAAHGLIDDWVHGDGDGKIDASWTMTSSALIHNLGRLRGQRRAIFNPAHPHPQLWPLPNVWLGVSVEDQEQAENRIPHLLDSPAALRFISAEPLLGEINLGEIIHKGVFAWFKTNALTGDEVMSLAGDKHNIAQSGVDWVICGGESGRDARPMHPDWARSLRDQCVAAGVPFFFKQWGTWQQDAAGTEHDRAVDLDGKRHRAESPGMMAEWRQGFLPHHRGMTMMSPVGKKAAGRVLDNRTWDEMPDPRKIAEGDDDMGREKAGAS
ncbi:MAG: phage Gp37/Gp68 family protein [Alphaproteobacteria bacterium]